MESEDDKQECDSQVDGSSGQSQPEEASPPSQRENAHQQAGNKIKKRYWSDKRWRHPQVIINGILAFIALIAAIIYYCELRQMKRAARIDQRAWVAPTDFIGIPEQNKPFIAIVRLKNTGKTFARNVKIRLFFQVQFPGQSEPDFANLVKSYEPQERGGIMAPNADHHKAIDIGNGHVFNQPEVDAIKAVPVFIFGKITYDDIFGCSHWTTFCVRFEDGEYHGHGKYNDADNDECP